MDTADLADACQALAEELDKKQAALNYTGEQATTFGKLSANLSAQVCSLRTLVVADAINSSNDAVNAIKDGTEAVNTAVKNLQDAANAIRIAGLVLSLGAAIISENPGSIISSARDVLDAVKAFPA
ncbi:MAG: hypothetical protein ACYCY2_15655 [Acidithiobacillus ferriphilus]